MILHGVPQRPGKVKNFPMEFSCAIAFSACHLYPLLYNPAARQVPAHLA
jgi:hypothetical protein